MKKLFKKLTALMLGALAIGGLASVPTQEPVKAEAATITAGVKFYLTPNSNWKADNARFAIYFFGGTTGEKWVSMTDSDKDGIYEATSEGNHGNLIFCRMNPSATANDWNNKWNQTADLTYDGTNNHYTVKSGTWDNGGGTWSYIGEEILEKYSITYMNGDEVWATKTDKTTYEDADTNPTKDGYVFTGWKDAAGKTVEGALEADVTVYAQFEEAAYYYAEIDNAGNWSKIYMYAFNKTDNKWNEPWPGSQMTRIGSTNFYYAAIAASKVAYYDNVIINNGSNAQTKDLTNANGFADYCVSVKTGTGTTLSGTFKAIKDTTAHIAGEALNVGSFETGLVATGAGVSEVALTRNGWAATAVADNAVITEECLAYFEAVDSCNDYANHEQYAALAEVYVNAGGDADAENAVDGEYSINEKIEYMAFRATSESVQELTSGNNLVKSNNSVMFILIVGVLGLASIAAYYFINKKKVAAN